MKAFFAALQRSPKLAVLSAALVGAVVVPATLMAWGPDRPTYTIENPANHVVFNSITNNPAYGDERNFVRIKEASAPDSTYTDNIQLQPGKEYEVYVYYHNNAKTSLNASGVGIAKDVKLRMEMPAVAKAGATSAINGYISASNANPGTVWDEARMTTASDVALRYVPNSAVIHSFGAVNNQVLPSSLMTTGAPLGFDALNGIVPGCEQFAGYVDFRIKAEQPNFEVIKQVAKNGQKNFGESVNVNPGEVVDYKIQYKNTGDVEQDNVIIKDRLPQGVTYIPGSTFVSNSKTNSQWSKVESDEVTKGGINIGAYAPNGNAYVKFSARVDGVCGTQTLINSASANTENGSKSDTANVVVTKVCQPGEVPPTELPTTGVDTGVMAFVGLGIATAAAAYAATSDRARNLLRR